MKFLSVLVLSLMAAFAAAECSNSKIPDNLNKQYAEMFKKIDTDGSGVINPADAHVPSLSTGVFGWLHNLGSHDAATQAKTLLEKAVLSKLSTDGAHSVDECEFANAMYHAQMTGQMFAGKLPNFGQYPEKQTPVVVKG